MLSSCISASGCQVSLKKERKKDTPLSHEWICSKIYVELDLRSAENEIRSCVTLSSCVSASGCQVSHTVPSQSLPGDQTGLWVSEETILLLTTREHSNPQVFANFLSISRYYVELIISTVEVGYQGRLQCLDIVPPMEQWWCVVASQPTGRMTARLERCKKDGFLLEISFMEYFSDVLSDNNRLCLLDCYHHLPGQRLVLLQGVTNFTEGSFFVTTLSFWELN